MKLDNFDQQIVQDWADLYLKELENFLNKNKLSDLFHPPVDHLAIKAFDDADFTSFLESLKDFSETITFAEINNRRLATARLTTPIYFSQLGSCYCIEVMEPRPEKVNKDLVGFEHIEIFHPDLEEVKNLVKKLHHEFQENSAHQAIVLKINQKGQEIKFTNTHLFDIEFSQLQTGEAQIFN
jgi:predicted metalloenzyme YecM